MQRLKLLTPFQVSLLCGVSATLWYGLAHFVIEPMAANVVGGSGIPAFNAIATRVDSSKSAQISALWTSFQINVYTALFVTAFCFYAIPWLTRTREGKRFDHLSILAFLWAFTTLVHQGHMGYMNGLSDDTAMTLAAIWVLFRPSCLGSFVVLLVVQFVSFTLQMPNIPNHPVFMGIGIISILICMARLQVLFKGMPLSRDQIYRDISMVLRIELILLYLVATVAKLNWSYIDPEISSAVALLDLLRERIGVIPDTSLVRWSVIYLSLLSEAIIPLFLLFARTRNAGLWYGWFFHLVLGVTGYLDFSSVVFLYYVLFTSEDFPHRLKQLYRQSPAFQKVTSRITIPGIRNRLTGGLMIGAIALGLFGQLHRVGILDPSTSPQSLVKEVIFYIWLAFALLIAVVYHLAMKRGSRNPRSYSFAGMVKHPIFLTGPILLLLNSVCPYLGLKTESTFTMFSDLKTESNEWNHVVLPKDIQVFPYQSDIVRIIASSDPYFSFLARSRQRLPFEEFHRETYLRLDASVSYERAGVVYSLDKIGDDPVLSRKPSLFVRKVMKFRPISSHDELEHRH